MKYGRVVLEDAFGAVLAHNVITAASIAELGCGGMITGQLWG